MWITFPTAYNFFQIGASKEQPWPLLDPQGSPQVLEVSSSSGNDLSDGAYERREEERLEKQMKEEAEAERLKLLAIQVLGLCKMHAKGKKILLYRKRMLKRFWKLGKTWKSWLNKKNRKQLHLTWIGLLWNKKKKREQRGYVILHCGKVDHSLWLLLEYCQCKRNGQGKKEVHCGIKGSL